MVDSLKGGEPRYAGEELHAAPLHSTTKEESYFSMGASIKLPHSVQEPS